MRMMLIWVGLVFCFVFFLPFCGAQNFHPGLQRQRQREAVCVCLVSAFFLPALPISGRQTGERQLK